MERNATNFIKISIKINGLFIAIFSSKQNHSSKETFIYIFYFQSSLTKTTWIRKFERKVCRNNEKFCKHL